MGCGVRVWLGVDSKRTFEVRTYEHFLCGPVMFVSVECNRKVLSNDDVTVTGKTNCQSND